MTNDEYKTIKLQSEGLYKDKGSKFYSFAFPVEQEAEIQAIRTQLKKKYYDARHHVYAYRLGPDKSTFYSSDDGEPSNSSGPPVLGQIKSFDLTNILIVVVRYFGGTKLGIPGLINAYKIAAANAILNSEIIVNKIKIPLKLEFSYPEMNDIMKIIKDNDIEIASQKFDLECKIELNIRKKIYNKTLERFKRLPSVKITKNS